MESTEALGSARGAEPVLATSARKRVALAALKLVGAAALIFWLLRGTNLGEVFTVIRSASIPLVVLAFSMNFVHCLLCSLRWRVLLRAQGVKATLPFLTASYMVSVFFNNFLPSTIGGDTVRAYDSWRMGRQKGGAVAVIMVDRLMGTAVLALFAVIALLLSQELSARIPFLHAWVLLGALGLAVIIGVIFMPSRMMAAFRGITLFPFSSRLQRIFDKTVGSFSAFGGRKDVLVRTLALSLLVQANVVVHYYVIGKALGFPVPLAEYFLIVPIALVVMMLPVSINGIGVRESAFAFLLAPFGVSRVAAVAFAWLAFGALLLQTLLGGVVYALRR